MTRFVTLLIGAVAALALGAAPALASRDYAVEFMDDQLLLGKSEAQVNGSLGLIKFLGGDRLRVSAYWRDIAPSPLSRTRPAGFDAGNHNSPGYRWADLDRVVGFARLTHGLGVMITITTPGPIWASWDPARRNPVWMPSPDEFADFARAVAQRYRGYADRFAIGNEPNQGGWLQPQSSCAGSGKRRHCRPYAPHHYRKLVNAAAPKIAQANPEAQIVIGELASGGNDELGTKKPLRPLLFLREMGCRDRRMGRLRSAYCRGFEPAAGHAIGHHPYKFFTPPDKPSPDRDDAGMGDTRRLIATVDALQRRRAIRKLSGGRFPIHYTEYGYQTDPPDPIAGIPLARQSRWLQEAAYFVWRQPRVRTLNQFRVTDGAISGGGRQAFHEFQSGLMFANTRKKPSFRSFPDPFNASPARLRRPGTTLLWGQVRPGGAHTVTLERRTGRSWAPLATIATDRYGGFTRRVRVSRTTRFRFRYADSTTNGASDTIVVGVHR